jgi:hypothetical protein
LLLFSRKGRYGASSALRLLLDREQSGDARPTRLIFSVDWTARAQNVLEQLEGSPPCFPIVR